MKVKIKIIYWNYQAKDMSFENLEGALQHLLSYKETLIKKIIIERIQKEN